MVIIISEKGDCALLPPQAFHMYPREMRELLRGMQAQSDLGVGARTEKRFSRTSDEKHRTGMTSQGHDRVGSN